MERAHRELPDGERRVQRSIVNTSRSFAPKNLKSDPMKRLRGKCAAVDLVGCDVRDTRYPVTVSEGTGRGRWARAVCEQRW